VITMKKRATFPLLFLSLLSGCALYDPPPEPSLDGEVDGLIARGHPLQVVFSEPIDPATLRLSVVPLVTDAEGYLGDEDAHPETQLDAFFTHDPAAGQSGGTGVLSADGTRFSITPAAPLPIGPKLAVLIEPGLGDLLGNDTGARQRLTFAYEFKCAGGQATSLLPDGGYFFLFDIEKPFAVQIQILADVRIDPATGELVAQFTNADRNKDPTLCPMPCEDTEVCRLLPEPACVLPSEKAGSVDEYPDFLPNPTPPTGFSFAVKGCAEDAGDGSAVIATVPTSLVVQQPPVEAVDLAITCSFTAGADGVLRCNGSSGAKDVLIGGSSAGPAEGTSAGRPLPPEDVPDDLPPAP
jgi:hypothetical protein